MQTVPLIGGDLPPHLPQGWDVGVVLPWYSDWIGLKAAGYSSGSF